MIVNSEGTQPYIYMYPFSPRWHSDKRICLPVQEIWVQFLGWEDPLEEEMTTHSSILSWKIPWTKEPGGLQSMGSQRVRHDFVTKLQQHHSKTDGL